MLCGAFAGVNLVVATGSTAKPSFERIRLDKTNKAGGITEFTVGEVQVGCRPCDGRHVLLGA